MVKLNLFFLIIGLILTVLSKVLQFVFQSKVGDFVVIPAGVSFVLALLFSINKFNVLFEKENGSYEAFIIALFACLAIVMFQLALMLLIGYKIDGVLDLLPYLLFA